MRAETRLPSMKAPGKRMNSRPYSYQRPQLVTGLAHSRRVMEAIRSGMAMSAFQAWQQVSTIAA
jgi:hypothetical protein